MNYLVFDAGGTFIKYAVMNEKAEILEKSKVPTPKTEDSSLEDYLNVLEDIYHKYEDQIKGIAMSAPGILDSETGYCYSGGYLGYTVGQNPAMRLQERCHVPVTLENDGKCAALAELWMGSLKGIRNGAVVVLGSGVGGGLILNGQLYKGRHFSAGEFSYVAANVNNAAEAPDYWGIVSGASALADEVSAETGIPANELDGIRIFEMAEKGDKKVLDAIDLYTHKLAVELYNLQALLDLDRISLGGGISQQPLLLKYVRRNVEKLCSEHPFKQISPYIPTPEVTVCSFFNDSNLIGALYHHLYVKGEH